MGKRAGVQAPFDVYVCKCLLYIIGYISFGYLSLGGFCLVIMFVYLFYEVRVRVRERSHTVVPRFLWGQLLNVTES